MFFEQVKRTVERFRLLEKKDRVIVGVSGGIDSMVLLRVLDAFRSTFALTLIVAHIDHGLRPAESEREADLVRREAERLGLILEYGQFDVKSFQMARGLSIQDAARKVRFHFFHRVLQKHGAQKIALGHHADDQVETLLLRLMRGSSLKGLKGMLPIREGKVIRPLLERWRHEIETYAIEQGIPYLEDSSNRKESYLRNRVRLSLIPLIEREYQPNFKNALMRTSVFLREENDYLERKAEEAYQDIVREGEGDVSFHFPEFQTLHQAIQWRVFLKMVGRVCPEEAIEEGVSVVPIYEKLKQASPSFTIELTKGICLEKRYDRVWLGKKKVQRVPPFEVDIAAPGRTWIDEIGKEVFTAEILKGEAPECPGLSSQVAFLDLQKLRFPLKVRNFRPGDRFHPLGARGSQKLKEFLIDHKIPRFEREKIPLLISGERIAWVVGLRIDERVKMTEMTEKVLKVEVN